MINMLAIDHMFRSSHENPKNLFLYHVVTTEDGRFYRVASDYVVQTPIIGFAGFINDPESNMAVGRIEEDGKLTIFQGYCYDGASGPAIDTASFMRAACVHDILYLAIELGILPDAARGEADLILRRIATIDDMPFVRRWYAYYAVRLFGGFFIKNRKTC